MDTYRNIFPLDVMERGHIIRDAVLDGNFDQVKTAIETGTCNPNEADSHGRTPLHLAACRGHTEIMRLLVENGADPKSEDRHGNTPLHWCGHVDGVDCLTSLGADVSTRNKLGFTARELAERRGVPKDVLILFRHLEEMSKTTAPSSVPSRTHLSSPSPVKSQVSTSIWHEFCSDLGKRNVCLLILGLLFFSLYAAYILTGLHLGEHRIPLDEMSYKIHM